MAPPPGERGYQRNVKEKGRQGKEKGKLESKRVKINVK
jgi:hypothetical protein